MPEELAEGFRHEGQKVDPLVRIDSPIEPGGIMPLSAEEIRRLRMHLAWRETMPPLFDSLIILSPTNATGRRMTSRSLVEYHFAKNNDRWQLESVERRKIENPRAP